MKRKDLEELAIYCNGHYCEECKFCKECDEIEKKIDIAELTSEISNSPCYWDDEDINCILTLISKEG